jgi:hypothetical protein
MTEYIEYAEEVDNDRYDGVDEDDSSLTFYQRFKRSIIRDLDKYALKLHTNRRYIIIIILVIILLVVILDIRWSRKKGLTSNIVQSGGGGGDDFNMSEFDIFGKKSLDTQVAEAKQKQAKAEKIEKKKAASEATKQKQIADGAAIREARQKASENSKGANNNTLAEIKKKQDPAKPANNTTKPADPAAGNNASKKLEVDKEKGVEDPAALAKKDSFTKKQLKKGSAKLGDWKNNFMSNFKSGPMQNIGDILGTSLSSAFWFVGFIFTALGFISLPFIIVVAATYTVLKYLLSFFSGL